MLWVEKYRPHNFEAIIGIDKSIEQTIDNLPNFIFYGPPGTGKTTTAKVIIDTLKADSLVLNSSLDRKIEVVRTKVKDFVSTKSSNNKIKIVFLDEADGLLAPVQESLRGVIESHHKWVRWILTCNNINKLTDALKSRCRPVKFTAPKRLEIAKRLVYILEQEKCAFDTLAISLLVDKLYPDMRSMINEMQSLTNNGKEELTEEKVNTITTLLEKVIIHIKEKKFDEARTTILNDGVEPTEFFNELYLHLMKSKRTMEQKQKINEVATQCNYYSVGGLSKNISLEAFLFSLMRLGI